MLTSGNFPHANFRECPSPGQPGTRQLEEGISASSSPPPLLNLRLRVLGLAQIELPLPAPLVIAEVPVGPTLGDAPALALVGPHLQLQPAVPVRPRLDHRGRRRRKSLPLPRKDQLPPPRLHGSCELLKLPQPGAPYPAERRLDAGSSRPLLFSVRVHQTEA